MSFFDQLKALAPSWTKSAIKALHLSFLLRRLRQREDVSIARGVEINEYTRLESHTAIYLGCNISGSYIGKGTYIGAHSSIRNTKVGRFCSIGANVTTCLGAHPAHTFVSTHPSFFSTGAQAGFTFVREQFFDELPKATKGSPFIVEIGNDVWIGNNVLILDGICVANGSIVGAGAVVTKDVEPYSINIGVPAKCIGYRFDAKTIALLLEFKWWDRDFEWLQANARNFQNIDMLKYSILHLQKI